jgi:glucose/arabinose dehydrogenase
VETEINIVKGVTSYGWPVVTYGIDTIIRSLVKNNKKRIQDPEYYWAPSIAPSGMAHFVTNLLQAGREFISELLKGFSM